MLSLKEVQPQDFSLPQVIQFPRSRRSNLRLVKSPGNPPDPEHNFLRGSGFDVWMELGSLVLNLGNNLSLNRVKENIKGNLLGFYYEYLRGLPVVPNPIDLVEVKGRKRLFSRFGNRDLIETIDEAERFGAVKRVFKEDVSQFVETALPGDLIAVNSPPDWSGLKDNLGREIVYPDTQTYAFQINSEGNLEALTFVSDLNFEQGKNLLKSLGVDSEFKGSYQQQLAQMVSRPIILRAKEAPDNLKLILEKIQAAKGSKVMRVINNEVKTFAEAFKLLEERNRLLSLDSRVQAVLDGFNSPLEGNFTNLQSGVAKILKNHPNLLSLEREKAIELIKAELVDYSSFYKIADQMCVTIGKLHLLTKQQRTVREVGRVRIVGEERVKEEQLNRGVYEEIARIAGCNGGKISITRGFTQTPLGIREVIFIPKEKGWSYHKGDCRSCGKEDTIVGPCQVCKSCEVRIDRMEWIDKKYAMLDVSLASATKGGSYG